MKWFKRLLMLVGALLLVAVIAAVAFVATFDPNDYKQRIADVVKEKTGRTVEFNGPISLTVFPWLGVTVKDVSLSNAQGFAPKEMVQAKEVEAKAALLPLLKGQFEIGTLVLDGAVINLERKADGKTNWADLAQAGGKSKTPSGTKEQKPAGGGQAMALAVGGVDIRNSTLNWRDALAHQQVSLQKVVLQTGALSLDQPMRIHAGFDFDLALKDQQPLKGSLAMDGTLQASDGFQEIKASDLALNVKADSAKSAKGGAGLPQQVIVDLKAPVLQLSLKNQGVSLPAFTLGVQASKLGSLSYVDAQLGGDVEANWGKGQYASKNLSVKGTVKGLPTHTGTLTVDGSGAVQADLPKGTAELTGWRLASDPLVVKTSIKVSGIGKALTASGPINIEQFNPRELAKAMNYHVPPMQSDKALTSFAMQGQVDVTPKQAMLDQIRMNLDGHAFTGKAGIGNLKSGRILARLEGGKFDVNPYLPPSAAGSSESKPSSGGHAGGGGQTKIPLPIDALRALNLDAQVHFTQLTYQKYVLGDPTLAVTAAGGLISVDKLYCKAFSGTLDGKAGLDVRGSVPAWRGNMTTKSVQLQPMLKAAMNEDRLIGTGDLSFNLKAQGDRVDQLKSSLDGDAKFALKNGKVKGVDLGYLLRKAQAALQGKTTSVPQQAETDFSSITGSATITNGLVRNKDLRGASPLLRVEGSGQVDLARSSIDYLLKAIVVNTTTGQGGKELEKLKQVPVPIKITGSLSNPQYGVDLQSVLKDRAKQEIKDRVGKEIQKNLGDKAAPVQNLLKGFGL